MKKKAFTLIELIIAMVLSGILIIAMTCQFVALNNFTRKAGRRSVLAAQQEELTVVREARIVTNHMERTLRFAKPDDSTNQISFINTGAENRLTVKIKGGYLPSFQNDAVCYYSLDKSSSPYKFYFSNGTTAVLLSSAVVSFLTDNTGTPPAVWDSANAPSMLTLRLDFADSHATVPIETKVRTLGGT